MRYWSKAAALGVLIGLGWVALGLAQETIGGLRIVDDTGAITGQEEAPAGEKLYRLPAGVIAFNVAMDYDGSSPTDVQVRVMGPSGTVLFQKAETLTQPGPVTVVVTNGGQPFADQEYVVNAYVGADQYLADSLQLVVGEAQLPTPEEAQATSESSMLNPVSAMSGTLAETPSSSATAPTSVPGGPSNAVLGLAVAGILALTGIVVWAAWSATHRT